MGAPDAAGRVIAGLLTHNPGPGIYSRMARAVDAMPPVVRMQEMPGLLRRYKAGVPSWEVQAVAPYLPASGSISRSALAGLVQEHSPVYTHREIVLGGTPQQTYSRRRPDAFDYERQTEPSPIGRGIHHGEPRFEEFGQGGENYAEILLIDPSNPARLLPAAKPHHFHEYYPGGTPSTRFSFGASQNIVDAATGGTAGFLRFDRHGDALRLNELQSDIHNHNIKAGSFERQIPFIGPEATRQLLIKRWLLEAARQGTAMEIAAPQAISDQVNMDLEAAQHLYGKVYRGDLERAARPLGGLIDDTQPPKIPGYREIADDIQSRLAKQQSEARQVILDARSGLNTHLTGLAVTPGERFEMLSDTLRSRQPYADGPGMFLAGPDMWGKEQVAPDVLPSANELYHTLIDDLLARGADFDVARQRAAEVMPRLMRLAEDQAIETDSYNRVMHLDDEKMRYERGLLGDWADYYPSLPPASRHLLPAETRKRILTEGIGASVLAPLMYDSEDE